MMKAIFPKSHSKKESVDQAVHRLSDRAQVHGEQATTSAVGGSSTARRYHARPDVQQSLRPRPPGMRTDGDHSPSTARPTT
jgi:hypothetical protein